ncbi:MAG: hypothetical protein IH895_08305 [Planctomycetes bacterium]|nr:hypothetical protein [Planctomycetota bacterium]
MELQHVNVKIYVDGDLAIDPAEFIDVFHEWIREHTLDELLIDVADYRHVPAGPGVMLIGHEADYSMDNAGDRWGLRYNRKAAVDGSNDDRLRQALRCAARACQLLEEHFNGPEPLRFSRREFELFINDRALAPNTPETLAACRPMLESFLASALGHDDFSLEPRTDPRSLFGVTVTVARPFDLTAILETLGS